MSNNTVLFCYDYKEKALAEELKEHIDELFDNKFDIKLCGNSSGSKDKSVWKELLEETFKSEKALIFVLCSPFSIGQSWVNFISGAITIKIEKENDKNKDNKAVPEKKLPKIIPICHSGQKSKDLPHYLLSRQAMDIQHDSFLNSLISTLAKELSINKIELDDNCKKAILQRLRNVSYSANPQPEPERNDELAKTEYFYGTLKREDGETINIIPIPSSEKTSSLPDERASVDRIEKMHSLLARKKSNAPSEKTPIDEVNAWFALRRLNCLYDKNNGKGIFYVCLMRQLEVDTDFKSYCSSKGIFEPGYIPPKSMATKEKPDGIDNKNVLPGSPEHMLIKSRAEKMGHTLWNLKVSDKETVVATIFVNRSEPVPRFEIAVWKVINISDLRDKIEPLSKEDSAQQKTEEEEVPMSYWIWVKDGEIHYWTFPNENLIPRLISRANNEEATPNPRLITAAQMREYYGRPEKYTPFAADDVLGVENVIKEHFSAAARSLLYCF